jgi:RimJ/RimL family protein N-acetyltransferase
MSQCFPDRLNSARLSLRRLQPNDEEPICAYRSLPQVARYQYWDKFSPDDAARLVKEQVGAEPNIPGTWFQLAIIESKTGRIIGDCGLHCRKEDPHQMEIGITLAPSHQGLRYSDEAVECLLDYVFRSLDKHRVFARVDTLNR